MEEQRPQRQQKPQKHYSKMEQDYITVCKAIRKAFPLQDNENSRVIEVLGLYFLLKRGKNNRKKIYVNMLHEALPQQEDQGEEKKEDG